jgi:hypothetical protein
MRGLHSLRTPRITLPLLLPEFTFILVAAGVQATSPFLMRTAPALLATRGSTEEKPTSVVSSAKLAPTATQQER